MREISKIIIHCSATPPDMDIGRSEIDRWHKQRGWSGIGYHFVIRRDGGIETGRPVSRMGAHTKGHNRDSIGVCWIGGVDAQNKPEDNRTQEQRHAMGDLVSELRRQYPQAQVHGHRDFARKACPSFVVEHERWAT